VFLFDANPFSILSAGHHFACEEPGLPHAVTSQNTRSLVERVLSNQ
jgi:hypothetical protein